MYLAYLLAVIAASIVIGIVSAISDTLGALLYGVLALAYLVIIIPMLSLSFRRLHGIEKSAWWLLIGLIPFLGAIVLIVFYVMPGTKGPNRFGPDPLASEHAEVFA